MPGAHPPKPALYEYLARRANARTARAAWSKRFLRYYGKAKTRAAATRAVTTTDRGPGAGGGRGPTVHQPGATGAYPHGDRWDGLPDGLQRGRPSPATTTAVRPLTGR